MKLVLCDPFRLKKRAPKPANWEQSIAGIRKRQEIVARLAAKYGAALVHFQPVFDEAVKRAPAEHWIWDGAHPTYSGHQLMAEEWMRVVKEFWK